MEQALRSYDRNNCDFSCNERMCTTLDNAGVPADGKWRSLILYMRNINTHKNLSNKQKLKIQQNLIDLLSCKTFSDDKFHEILEYNQQVINEPIGEKLNDALAESTKFLLEFQDLMKRRKEDVHELGVYTVDSIDKQEPKELILNLRIAFKKVTQSMENDVRALSELSTTDGLTGINNRRSFDSYINEKINSASKCNLPLSCIFLDIDHFKKFNDTYGHRIGDQALKTVANILKKAADNFIGISGLDCFVARFGGEEMAILLPEVSLADALDKAEILRDKIESYNFIIRDNTGEIVKKGIQITASFGVAEFNHEWINSENPVEKLIDATDYALYEAKNSGRNMVCYYDDMIYQKEVANYPSL